MMRCFCSTGWSGFPHTGEERQEVKDKSVLGPPLFPPVVNPFPFHPFLLALGPFLFLLPFQQLHLWPIVRLFSSFLFISSCFIYLLLLLLLLFLFLISHLLKKKKCWNVRTASSSLYFSLSLSPGTSSLFLSYSSCLVSTSSWSVSPLILPPFFLRAFSVAKSPRISPEGFHSPGKHRGIFSPSCSFFQMPWAVQVYMPEGKRDYD